MFQPLRHQLRRFPKGCWLPRRGVGTFERQQAVGLLDKLASKTETKILTEYDALQVVGAFGIGVLQHHIHTIGNSTAGLAERVPALSAVKGILRYKKDGSLVTHKTEYKAVELRVPREKAEEIVDTFVKRFEKTDLQLEGLMFREWVEYEPKLGNEVLISAYQDPVFGPCVVVAFGGVLVNAYKDELNIRPVVIPVVYGVDSFLPLLKASTLVKFLTGQLRGTKPLCEWEQLEQATRAMAEGILHFSTYNPEAPFVIEEIEVNPAAVENGRIVALDSVLTVSPPPAKGQPAKAVNKLQILLQPKSMGLLGASEKFKTKTFAAKAFGASFRRFAKTKMADQLIKRAMKYSVYRGKKPAASTATPKAKSPLAGLFKPVLDFLKDALVPQNFNPCNSILAQAAENSHTALFPIHRKAATIQNVPCVKSLEEMKQKNGGKPVDVLVVAIPATDAVKALEECFTNHYCESVQLFSAGFAETEHGRDLQKKLLQDLAKMSPADRPLINGPNTVGNWVSGSNSFNTIFADDPRALVKDKETQSTKPAVALICQSGGFAVARLSGFSSIVHTSMCVTVGNQMDVSACDVLENLLNNGPPQGTPMPVVVGIYMEGLAAPGDGLRLMMLVAKARRQGITVVLYKAGRTSEGQRAVASHTASMATDYGTFELMLKHAGAVMANNLEEFHILVATAALLGPNLKQLITAEKKPESVGICGVTNSGYLKCGMADSIPRHVPGMGSHIVPATYEEDTRKAIEGVLAAHRLTDVVDIGEFLDVTPAVHIKGWSEVVYHLLKDPNPVGYIFAPVLTPVMVPNPNAMFHLFDQIQRNFPAKKFIVCIESGSRYAILRRDLWAAGIPCFETADRAMEVLCRLLQAWLRPL